MTKTRKTGLTLVALKKALNVKTITFTQESEYENAETGEQETWLSHFDIEKRLRFAMPKAHLDPKAKFTLITEERETKKHGAYTNFTIYGSDPVVASL